MTIIQIQIPENTEAGDSLTFNVEGTEFEIPVPVGYKPGDILQIEVGRGNSDDSDSREEALLNNKDDGDNEMLESSLEQCDDEENYVVPLHEAMGGVTLDVHCSISKEEQSNNDQAGLLSFEGESYEDGTYAMAWPAAFHLVKYISSPKWRKNLNSRKSVVELGSGLGIVGIAYISTLSLLESSSQVEVDVDVVLTDLPSVLPLIEHNIARNRKRLSSDYDHFNTNIFDKIRVEALIWGEKVHSFSGVGKFDLILASDILYNTTAQTYHALCETISLLVQNKQEKSKTTETNDCDILISVRWRKPIEERLFFELMETKHGFNFDLITNAIEDANYRCDLNWREFGNPDCAKSNEYFTNTFTEVRGEALPLKDITEVEMDKMSEAEYTAFEARFIQVYAGRLVK